MEYEWVVFYFYAPSPNTSQFATRSVNVSHLCPHFLTIVRKWGHKFLICYPSITSLH